MSATKTDLIVYAQSQMPNLPKATVSKIVDATIAGLFDLTLREGGITIRDEFTMTLVNRAARIGRNPTTGEKVNVPKKRAFKMKVARNRQKSLNA